MGIDYIKLFKTPDELVDFLMLDIYGQKKVLKELAEAGKLDGEMNCSLQRIAGKAKKKKCRR